MKKIATLLFLFICLHSVAQDTTKVEQYCELIATSAGLLGNKITIDVNYGEERHNGKDYRVKDDKGKAQKFNSIVGALNYMGKLGWKLVNAYPTTLEKHPTYYFYFKKEFLKSEITGE